MKNNSQCVNDVISTTSMCEKAVVETEQTNYFSLFIPSRKPELSFNETVEALKTQLC